MSDEMRRAELMFRATNLNEMFYMKDFNTCYLLDKLIHILVNVEKIDYVKVDLILKISSLFSEYDYVESDSQIEFIDELLSEVCCG